MYVHIRVCAVLALGDYAPVVPYLSGVFSVIMSDEEVVDNRNQRQGFFLLTPAIWQ